MLIVGATHLEAQFKTEPLRQHKAVLDVLRFIENRITHRGGLRRGSSIRTK